ncbi:hypothetical protein KY343_01910 [Candidatus Woesearchaeota archaeon]|nr:hypothetical protein [Candidatus Woesearchaeota archaeon]
MSREVLQNRGILAAALLSQKKLSDILDEPDVEKRHDQLRASKDALQVTRNYIKYCENNFLPVLKSLYDTYERLKKELGKNYPGDAEVLALLGLKPKEPADSIPQEFECTYGPDTITIKLKQ